jgi:hypothetical protein
MNAGFDDQFSQIAYPLRVYRLDRCGCPRVGRRPGPDRSLHACAARKCAAQKRLEAVVCAPVELLDDVFERNLAPAL